MATYDTQSTSDYMSKAKITSEKNVTINFIVKEANNIWNKYKKANIPLDNYEAIDKYFKQVCDEHKELYQAYPTVLRLMIQLKKYDTGAFTKYLRKIEKQPWTNDETRMDSYTDYMIMVYRATTTHYNMTQLSELKRNYRKLLQDEHDKFLKNYKELEENEETKVKARRASRTAKSIEQFQKLATANNISLNAIDKMVKLVLDGTISCEDLDTFVSELARKQLQAKRVGDVCGDEVLVDTSECCTKTALEDISMPNIII